MNVRNAIKAGRRDALVSIGPWAMKGESLPAAKAYRAAWHRTRVAMGAKWTIVPGAVSIPMCVSGIWSEQGNR